MKVLILYTLPPEELAAGRDDGEFDLLEAAGELMRVLPDAEVAGIRGTAREVAELLESRRPDVIFNLCEAPLGRPDLESHVAAFLEWRGIPFTGCGSETLALCRRKDRAKAVLAAAKIPVPRDGVFPCFVKPADQDGSTSIYHDSVCEDDKAVEKAKARIAGPAIVEEFLPGKEFVVAVWGRRDADYFSIGEVTYSNGLRIFTYASKWDLESSDYKNSMLHYNTEIEPNLRIVLTETARNTWRAIGARGYLRMDMRLDGAGVPRVLDVNPNPEMSPEVGMHRAVVESGWTWEQFAREQVNWALSWVS